jgi:microcystin-dependent protein
MDDTRISQLTFGEPLEGDEYIPIVQYSPTISALETVYTTPSALAEYIIGEAVFYPVGAIIPYAGALSAKDIPKGWLLCDGSEVSIDAYPNLYNCIVNTYGSTASGVFALPNLRGRVIVGYEDVGDMVNFNSVEPSWPRTQDVTIGATGGEFYHKLTAKDIPCTTTAVAIPSAVNTAVNIQPTIVPLAPKEVEIYNRSEKTNARTSWTDTLNLGAYGNNLPSTLDLKFYFGQCEVRVTDAGVWVLVGSTGNNASKTIIKSVRPDGNGIVQVRVVDRAWGGHGLKVHALVPQYDVIQPEVIQAASTTSTSAVIPSDGNLLVDVTQPYMLMNYIIKH